MMVSSQPPDVLSYFWAPLCAVGARAEARRNAQICVSVFGASIVPEQPRILVVLSKSNYTHDLVLARRTLAVTLLAHAQLDLLEPLGLVSGRDRDKLAGLDPQLTACGDPYFPGGVGYLACDVLDTFDFGDSTAFLSAVRARERFADTEPMSWADAGERIGADFLQRWAEKSQREQQIARGLMRWT